MNSTSTKALLKGISTRHEKALRRSLLAMSIAFAFVGFALLFPFVGSVAVTVGSMLRGSPLRRPDKWLSLLHKAAAWSLLASASSLGAFLLMDRFRHRIQDTQMFLVLFFLLAMHAPDDFFEPYLWAEDGTVLIQGAVFDGLKCVLVPGNGCLWTGQKLMAFLCYMLVRPFNSIAALPYIQQTLSKILATFSIFYFVSDRFSWLVEKRLDRFLVCVALTVIFPPNAVDVVTCETSLPVYFIFTVFLIGVDLLVAPKRHEISWGQTAFLVIFALSWPAAPFAIIVAGLSFLRYLACSLRNRTLTTGGLLLELAKTAIVASAVLVQLIVIMGGGRCSSDLDLWHRFVLNTKNFFFLPYVQPRASWAVFALGLACWILFWAVGRTPPLLLAYSGLFSWGLLLLSSMVSSADGFYQHGLTVRYYFTSFEIALFILMVSAIKLVAHGNETVRKISFFLLLALPVADVSSNYKLNVVGAEFAKSFKDNCFVFDRKGKDIVRIAIGPWNYWTLTVPANIGGKDVPEDMVLSISAINGNIIDGENYVKLNFNLNPWGTTNLVGQAQIGRDGPSLTGLFMKNPADGSYNAAYAVAATGGTAFSFSTNLPPPYFSNGGTELVMYGRAADGSWHMGKVTLLTSIE